MGFYSGTTNVVSYASSSKGIQIEFKKLIDFFVLKKMFNGLRIKNQFVLKLKMRTFGLKNEIKMRIKVSLPVDDGDESSDFFAPPKQFEASSQFVAHRAGAKFDFRRI